MLAILILCQQLWIQVHYNYNMIVYAVATTSHDNEKAPAEKRGELLLNNYQGNILWDN